MRPPRTVQPRRTPRWFPLVLALGTAVPSSLPAASQTWTGTIDGDFETAGNWSTLPANDLTSDTGVFSGSAPANLPFLSTSRSLLGLSFVGPGGDWTLTGNPAAKLALGAGGLAAVGASPGTNTIAANLEVAAAQNWATGGTLVITGAITGTAGLPLSFFTATERGTVILSPSEGRSLTLTGSTSAGVLLAARQGGLLMLGGDGVRAPLTTSVNSAVSTGNFGTLAITGGGAVEVHSGTWNFGDFSRNSSSDYFSGTLTVKSGDLRLAGARYLAGGTLTVEGGALRVTNLGSIYSNGGKFALGSVPASGTATLQVTGGLLDLAQANGAVNGGNSLGVGMSARVNQTGGTVQNGITVAGGTNGGTTATLTIGHSGLTSTGSGTTQTFAAVSNVLASYTLAGGTLLSAGTIQGTTPAVSGTNGSASAQPGAVINAGTNNVRNFNFVGGTLSVVGLNATALGYASASGTAGGPPHSDPAANSVGLGTLFQHGGTLAPGGDGIAGRTTVTGNYRALGGALAVDIGGTTAATAFQGPAGQSDVLVVTGTATIGGTLHVRVLPGFTPAANQSFTVLTAAAVTGTLVNAPSGSRVVSTDGRHTFVLTQSGTAISLGNYAAVTAPTITGTSAPSLATEGDAVVLGLTTQSLAPVTYEWRKDGVLLPEATGSSLTFVSVTAADSGTYEVTVRNAVGSVTQSFPLVVTVPPSTQTLVVDAGATQSFAAAPGASIYRWVLDGDTVGTDPSFTYLPQPRDVGTHWLRVEETYPNGSSLTREWTVRVRIPTPEGATVLYVSPSGTTGATGSLAAPFATLEQARDAIRALPAGAKAGGVTVYLRGGIHRRTTTLTLTSQDSGTPGAPITYAAYPGETPILTSTRVMNAGQFAPLAASEHSRVAPGIDPAKIWEADVTGNARAAAYPSVTNEWVIHNALRTSLNGGQMEVFYQGARQNLSRYPNPNATDDTKTTNLTMNGVAAGAAVDGSGYLNGAGTYTLSTGTTALVGGAFHYNAADASRVARWQTALTRGGLWVMGYWRVPWQVNAAKVSLIDPGKSVIGLVTNPSNANNALISNGIGDKYNRPAGSKKEPWWVINLLEEIDQPGEWCIDFSRNRLYLYTNSATVPADGEVELSDTAATMIQLNGASDVRLQGLTFRRHLGISIQILNGARNYVLGCNFAQTGNLPVDINGGTGHGVVSSNFEKLAAGGVMVRGGALTPAVTKADHFVVNNRFRSFGEVVRVYQAAVDVGFGGPMGNWGLPTVGMRVAHNDIRTSPHAGILWNGYQSVIEYNEISNFTRVSNDFGGIYRFGPNIDSGTVIRYNHLFDSPQGEGIYNDYDHVRTPIYGNVVNLKTPATSSRGYGFWTNTNTATGGSVAGLPMGLQLTNNIAVNSRSNYSLHSATGGTIANNVSYRKLDADFLWYRITTSNGTNSVTTSNAATLQSGPNLAATSDPGFISFATDDLRLRPDAAIYRDLPGFEPIPLEMAGLGNDEFRSDARVWTPFIVTETASAVGANTATFVGTLVYPQFNANATVRVYWGTTDGDTNPAAWDQVTDLGQPGSGVISHTPKNLLPNTRYYFRFHAENAAGEHWSEASNSTTTFPLEGVPGGGTASASSAATSADLAFDNNPATAWQAGPGVDTATLTYQFANNAAVRVTSYALVSAADTPGRDPRDWRVLGSFDGSTWVLLDTQANQTFSGRGEAKTYGFANTAAFRFYRLEILASHGDPAGLQLGDWLLFSPAVTPDTTGPVITTPGNLTVTGNSAGATVNFEVNAVDAITGNAAVTTVPASGSFFAVGTTTVTATSTDAVGNTSTATFSITVLPPTLPAPWTVQQIKPYSGVAPGSVEVLSATSFRITGAGGASTGGTTGDLWTGTNDSNTFLSVPWQGDGIFTARLASLTSTDAAAKAGIIVRETTNSGSRYSTIYIIRNNGGAVLYQHKTATSGASTGTNFFNGSVTNRGIPEWIRLVREGDTYSLFYSENGTTWTPLGSPRVNVMSAATLRVGFVVAPRTGGQTATAVFDNISFLTPLQNWRQTAFGTTSATGTAADSADPDADGHANLIEYALGTGPAAGSSTPGMASDLVQFEGSPAVHLTLSFDRIADPLLTYTVEGASSPGGPWTAVWSSSGAANVPGPVTVTDPTGVAEGTSKRFLRLRVTTP